MCLPVAALPIAAAAVSAVGSLTSGIMGMRQSAYEAEVHRRNIALGAERLRDEREIGRAESRDFYRQVGALKGQQIAALAANGLDLSFGTPLRVQEDTAMLADEDAAEMYRNQDNRLRGIDIEMSNESAAARATEFRGKVGMINSIFEAGAAVAGGFQQRSAISAAGYPSLMGGFQQQAGMRAKLGLTGG